MKILGVPDVVKSHSGIDVLGSGCRISPSCTVWRRNAPDNAKLILLGCDTVIHDNVRLVVVDPQDSPKSSIIIGDKVIVNVGSYLSGEGGLLIEDEVLIGPYVKILTAGHGLDPCQVNVIRNPETKAPVVIERGAWIGAGATILPGLRIGSGAVVGAGTVVTSDVPAMSVMVGNPGRIVRRRLEILQHSECIDVDILYEELQVTKSLYESLKEGYEELRRHRNIINDDKNNLENEYRRLESAYADAIKSFCTIESQYRDLENIYLLSNRRCEKYKHVMMLQDKFLGLFEHLAFFLSFFERRTAKYKNVEKSSKILSFSKSLGRRLRPRSRFNTLCDRYEKFGMQGVFQLLYNFAKRKCLAIKSQCNKTVATQVSLDIAKENLRNQAKIDFITFIESGKSISFFPGESPWLSVVLVLWGQSELTLACLLSLAAEARDSVEVIIVDNASTDATHRLLDRVSGAKIIKNEINKGFLQAANQGAMEASAPLLLFLNNDAAPRSGSLQNARAILDTDTTVGAVGGRIILPDGKLQEAGCIVWSDGSCLGYLRGENVDAPESLFRRDVDFCSGVFLMTRTVLFKTMQGFDVVYAPAYYEEVDYCLRLWESGFRVVYEPWVVVDHYEYGSSVSSDLAIQRMTTNQEIFRTKHAIALSQKRMLSINHVVSARMRGYFAGRVLYIDDCVPSSDLGSGFPRAVQLLNCMEANNLFVTVVSMAEPVRVPTRYLNDGIPSKFEVFSGFTPEDLAELLEERLGYYELFVVSRPSNMERLELLFKTRPDLLRGMKVCYDAEAVWAFREITHAVVTGHPMSEEQAAKLVHKELELAKYASCILTVSESEQRVFCEHGYRDVRVLSHAVPVCVTSVPHSERSDMLFVGALFNSGSPNIDSVVWFVKYVMPLLSASGLEYNLVLVGRNDALPSFVSQHKQVKVLGRVDDLAKIYSSCRVFVAPTRFSAGIPLKVVEAAGHGIPVVSTSLLAKQLGWKEGQELLVGDTPESFAQQCKLLYQDSELWDNVQAAALKRITSEYSREKFNETVVSLIDDYVINVG